MDSSNKITFKDIEKANSTLKTTPIKGKEYVQVNQRIKAFRMLYPEGFIKTEVIELDTTNGVIVMKAMVGFYDDNGNEHILGTGVAHEWRNKPGAMVNKTSYVENCDTSAIGRALGMIGLGVDVSIASAEEMNYAIAHQEEMNAKEPVNSTPVEEVIECKVCGNPVKGRKYKDKDGNIKTISPQKVADQTKDRFGKVMCWDCAHKEQEKLNAQKEKKMKVDENSGLPFPMDQ